MAILPEVLLRLWRAGDTANPNFHFYVTWEFAWSRAFRPVDDDEFREFYSWFHQYVRGEYFDEYLARMIKNYFDAPHEHDKLMSLRYNFYRGLHDGGNIIELVIKSDIDDIVDVANAVMSSLNEAFVVFNDEKLNSYWLSKELRHGQMCYHVDSRSQFYAEYARCHWGSSGIPMRAEEWTIHGPSSEVREMTPVGA
jgi:hypothetical protein